MKIISIDIPTLFTYRMAPRLTKNKTTIGTLDADGVALASIQALYQFWQDKKAFNREQNREAQEYKVQEKKLVQSLLTRIKKLEKQLL